MSRSLSLTRLSRSSPGLIPPLVTLAAQREGREPTGRTRSESGREVSDRHAERRGGRRECKTEPHVVPLSLRFGSLRPLVLRVFRRHFIPPVFIILRTPRSALRAAKRPPGSRLRREWSECSEGTRGVRESTEGPDCYQRLEFFIQVLRVLCPNLTDASLVVCVVSLTRRITRSLCSLVSLREGPDRQEGTRPEWGETEGRGFLPATAPSLPTVLRRPRWSASVPLATLIPSAYRLRPPAARM